MPKSSNLFPIVGIGASAGGLEALEKFFKNVPENSGMAYVVIQHLDPTHKGMLPELLQRISKMNVLQVTDHMKVKPNCIFVIPPNKSMSILNGNLRLFIPEQSRGLRLPIDFFFKSLAEDHESLGIGIVLSGMGSDGTIGLQAIKEKNGIAMAQEPSSAKFDSMPKHAINYVNLNAIATPEELHKILTSILKKVPVIPESFILDKKEISCLDEIVLQLKTHTGNDFSLYKKSTMYRRIERRIGVHKLDNISAYVKFINNNPNELEILFKELLIGVTSFFRDPNVWEELEDSIIPGILHKIPEGATLRAWVPGCSTGEEAYTLAITFSEALRKFKPTKSISLQIFASDLDNNAIESARKGFFSRNISPEVSPEILNRYFSKSENGYLVTSKIREMIVFAQHNLIMHPPFINIDLISCRNLLIYLDSELQHKIIGLFFYSLNTNGLLILGNSETIGLLNNLFMPLDNKLKIYNRSVKEIKPNLQDFPSAFTRIKTKTAETETEHFHGSNIQSLADQLLLQHYSPSSVLVNESGDILYISGHTGKYLEPASGKANLNIFAMLREGLRHEFTFSFMKVLKEKNSAVLNNLKAESDGNFISVNINIHYIKKPDQLNGSVMVVFTNSQEDPQNISKTKRTKSLKSKQSDRETELEKKLQLSIEEMQSTLEEMQTTQEELKSTNEELQSANEELQSANEELTSSREEMQSLNEELQTLNSELQAKVDDYSRIDNDMKNLLNSTEIATLFLDKELKIRRYTDQATKIFKLIKSDIGRLFTDQVSELNYPEMSSDANEVLRTLAFVQKQVSGKDGRWFSVRIMPYRTNDDRIEGLVITFIDITELKKVEEKLKILTNE